MQKKLEAELISIAHRILKLKNKSELDQLYLETGKLYEKLAVLRFLETHFSGAKPTIGYAEVSDKLAVVFDEPEVVTAESVEESQKNEISEVEIVEISVEENDKEAPKQPEADEVPEPEQEPEVEEPKIEEAPEEIEEPKAADEKTAPESAEIEGGVDTEIPEEEQVRSAEEEEESADIEHEIQETEEEVAEQVSEENKQQDFKPSFELSFERKEETDKKAPQQISFEELLGGHDYTDDIFEKVGVRKPEEKQEELQPDSPAEDSQALEEAKSEPVIEELKPEAKPEPQYQSAAIDKSEYEKPATSFNGKTITFGLNDRIGFEKNLFGGSSEDMNRVISQLNTFNTFQEAQDFIDDMVKPDYNDWENKDDYAQRFMDIVEKKFS